MGLGLANFYFISQVSVNNNNKLIFSKFIFYYRINHQIFYQFIFTKLKSLTYHVKNILEENLYIFNSRHFKYFID